MSKGHRCPPPSALRKEDGPLIKMLALSDNYRSIKKDLYNIEETTEGPCVKKAFRRFQNFIGGILTKYKFELKTLLLQGLSEPEFYGNLVYKFRKIIGKNDFRYHFKKIIVHYKKIGYNIDVLRHTACLVVNPIKVNSFAYLFNCTRVGRASH